MKKSKMLWALFVIFFKAGTFTFAGGLAMLPVIERDIVGKYKMMTKDEFIEYATLAQTLPGIIALNCSLFVGKRTAGFWGMMVAGFGATISAFVLMIVATIALQHIPQTGPIMGAMQCIRAASAALILSAAFSMGAHILKSAYAIIVMLAAFVAVAFFSVSAPLVVVVAGVVGMVYKWFVDRREGEV